ncbi:hypothetical protein NXT3_PC00048 (plasmid) [Sinorhizobium fredii]|uniref:Uncharacterized protein n=1 Tax=Rhizobium fredii TaxID=380 RepID=A0A2L0HEM3_RHIFR|nr:hypothetical protein NXT3_PC00048 [Sinorhizobium fredii]
MYFCQFINKSLHSCVFRDRPAVVGRRTAASRSLRWLEEGRARGLLDIGEPLPTARIFMDLIFGAAALETGQGPEWPG